MYAHTNVVGERWKCSNIVWRGLLNFRFKVNYVWSSPLHVQFVFFDAAPTDVRIKGPSGIKIIYHFSCVKLSKNFLNPNYIKIKNKQISRATTYFWSTLFYLNLKRQFKTNQDCFDIRLRNRSQGRNPIWNIWMWNNVKRWPKLERGDKMCLWFKFV